MTILAALLLGVSSASPAVPQEPETVMVVYMMGQSNAWGLGATHAQVNEPQYPTEPGFAFIWDKLAGTRPHQAVNDGEWVPLTRGFGYQNPPGSDLDAIGAELQLAYRLYREFQLPIYVIKTARGSTSLAEDNGDVDWSPMSSGELFDLWQNYYHRPAIASLYAQGKTPLCAGVFWGQGAADAGLMAPPLAAERYETNLIALIAGVREALGVEASFAIQRETDLPLPLFPNNALVRAAQEAVGALDPFAKTFSSDTTYANGMRLFQKHDREHFTGNGQRDLADGIAESLIRLRVDNPPALIPL